MGFALLLLAALDQYDAASEKVRMPPDENQRHWIMQSEAHRKLVRLISDRAEWTKAFRTIHEKLGLLPADPDIQVVFEDLDDKRPAWSAGKEGRGKIHFNMRHLGAFQKKLDEAELVRLSGKTVRWIVPPSRVESMITHELAHVVVGTPGDGWFVEGLATYAAGDDATFYDFNQRGARVEGLDQPLSEADAYPRGLAFFLWFEKEYGREKLHAFVKQAAAARGEKPGAQAAEVTGCSWEVLTLREKVWSEQYIAKFKNNP